MANTHSLDLELSSAQYASRADTASLSITGDISFECWAKLEQMPSTPVAAFMLATKYDPTAGNRSYEFFIDGTDKLAVSYSGDGASTTDIQSTSALSDTAGAWTHLAVTVDVSAKTAAMYVDGAAISVAAAAGTQTAIEDNASAFAIGTNDPSGTPGSFYDGLIDDVRIWNDIRTAGEISANYQKELVGDEAGLVGYWKLNNDYLDQTANSNDLTATAAPVFSTDVPTFPAGTTAAFLLGMV